MTELLPCPFCGGEADKWHGACWHVGCSIPGCAGYAVQNDDYLTEAEAIEAWNTRAKPPCGGNYCPLCGAVKRTCKIVHDSGVAHCDACGAGTYTGSNWDYWHYCPNCGARVVNDD